MGDTEREKPSLRRGPQAKLTRTWLDLYDRHMEAEVPV